MPTGPRPEPDTRQTKLVFHGSFGDAQWTNVLWLYLTGSGTITIPNLNSLASACFTQWTSHFLPIQSTSLLLERCQVVLYGSGDDVIEGSATGAAAGSWTGTASPANLATCISWQIAPHYRGGHPRTYLCGMVQGNFASTTSLSGAYVTAAQSAAAAFHSGVEGITGVGSGITTVEHGIVSFQRSGAWRTPPVFYRIAGSTVDTRIDTQRRRLGNDR